MSADRSSSVGESGLIRRACSRSIWSKRKGSRPPSLQSRPSNRSAAVLPGRFGGVRRTRESLPTASKSHNHDTALTARLRGKSTALAGECRWSLKGASRRWRRCGKMGNRPRILMPKDANEDTRHPRGTDASLLQTQPFTGRCSGTIGHGITHLAGIAATDSAASRRVL
jgi:hypothetical protein